MKRILIFSDTHHMIRKAIEVISGEPETALIIHAGDYVRDAEQIHDEFPNIPILYVRGNCDFSSNADDDIRTVFAGKKLFITHGHKYNVKSEPSLQTLKRAAEGFDLTVFGHTHVPLTEYTPSGVIVNPGSIAFSFTYAICDIDGDKLNIVMKEIW